MTVSIKVKDSDVLNVVIKLLALLLHIWKVSGSNLSPQTSDSDCRCNGFPQSLPVHAGTVAYSRSWS
jgi:hypothetical protein